MAEKNAHPGTDDPAAWIEWLDAASCTGYVDVAIPGGAVGDLIVALTCRAALEKGEAMAELLASDLRDGPLRSELTPTARRIIGAYVEEFQADLARLAKLVHAGGRGEPDGQS